MTPEKRKQATEKFLAEEGIAFNTGLPCTESASEIRLKSIDDICKRAIAALLSTQVAVELNEGHTKDAGFFVGLIDHFSVRDSLNQVEKRLLDGTCSKQDITDIVWEYECYWSLVWALGLVENITDADSICDCKTAINLVSQCESFEDFKSGCSLRSADEILDMLDLYYRYHWAVVQKRIVPDTPIGDLEGEVVYERRRGLEWLVCDTEDWYDISLDT